MLPKYKEIYIPLLRELARRGGRSKPSDKSMGKSIYEALAAYFDLTEADLDKQVFEPSNNTYRSKWKNMVRLARNDLVKKGLIGNFERGVWELTERGRIEAGLNMP